MLILLERKKHNSSKMTALENQKNHNQKNGISAIFLPREADKIISAVSARSQKMLKMRYGIGEKEARTLEEIGKKYGISRERVRQIINESIKKLKKSDVKNISKKLSDRIYFTIKDRNGIIREEEMFSIVSKEGDRGIVRLFLELAEDILPIKEHSEIEKSWFLSGFDFNFWKNLKSEAIAILKEFEEPINRDNFAENIARKYPQLKQTEIFNLLLPSKEIKENSFGKWGVSSSKMINPKGTREKIYLVFKETGKPLHFREITKIIDEKLPGKRKTHPQTVHNELIKDERFVLVGRGTYALSEWGYKKGTVKEILENILKENVNPMEKEEIVSKVLKLKKVKKATININLNNFFEKIGKNSYTFKKHS